MPYRRLPNTDAARIRALKTAINKKRASNLHDVFTINLSKVELMLRKFEASQTHYTKSLEIQVEANKRFQKLYRDARLFVSHFIQVLNMSIIRNEMKASVKKFYELPQDTHTVPELNNIESLLEIGEKVINGEQKRLMNGGFPIYNPTIARVNVAYSLFKDAQQAQKQYQSNTNRCLAELAVQRADMDETLKDLWNQIEGYFMDLPEEEKLKRCKEFGVIYYYRKGELEKMGKVSQ